MVRSAARPRVSNHVAPDPSTLFRIHKTRYALAHVAAARPYYPAIEARTVAHRFDRHHHVRRCHRAAGWVGLAGYTAEVLRTARYRRQRGAHRDVAADRRRMVRAQ